MTLDENLEELESGLYTILTVYTPIHIG